jgi:hypothetical protein
MEITATIVRILIPIAGAIAAVLGIYAARPEDNPQLNFPTKMLLCATVLAGVLGACDQVWAILKDRAGAEELSKQSLAQLKEIRRVLTRIDQIEVGYAVDITDDPQAKSLPFTAGSIGYPNGDFQIPSDAPWLNFVHEPMTFNIFSANNPENGFDISDVGKINVPDLTINITGGSVVYFTRITDRLHIRCDRVAAKAEIVQRSSFIRSVEDLANCYVIFGKLCEVRLKINGQYYYIPQDKLVESSTGGYIYHVPGTLEEFEKETRGGLRIISARFGP